MKNTIIAPKPGRKLWYWPTKAECAANTLAFDGIQPLSAEVVYVWHDRMVNLAILDQNGKHFARGSVRLLQGDEKPLVSESGAINQAYAQWPAIEKPITKLPAPEHNSDVSRAVDTLKEAFQKDPELAWSWHCVIAMSAVDAGASHSQGNEAAARFMQTLAGIDMRKHEHFPKPK